MHDFIIFTFEPTVRHLILELPDIKFEEKKNKKLVNQNN